MEGKELDSRNLLRIFLSAETADVGSKMSLKIVPEFAPSCLNKSVNLTFESYKKKVRLLSLYDLLLVFWVGCWMSTRGCSLPVLLFWRQACGEGNAEGL